MTSLQHRTLCRMVGWLLAVPLISCSEQESLCDRNPQWCQPFELLPIPEPHNLLDPDHPIAVRLATPDATPEPTKNSAYRVFVEQDDKAPPVRRMAMLPSPEKIEAGWLLRPQDLKPLVEGGPELRCGEAKLTLYARRYQTSTGTRLVADDPDSANYVQHGSTPLQVVREPVTPVTWMPGASPTVPMSYAGWTVTGLNLGPSSSGLVPYATVQDSTKPSVSPEIHLAQPPSTKKFDAGLFAGAALDGYIALHFRYMDSKADWVFCEPSSSDLMACAEATTPFQGAPPKSIAVDAKGKWLVSVDSTGTLRIQGYSYAAATMTNSATFAVQSPTLEMSSPMYRQAVVGDLDGDGDADVLAWGNSPQVLLQDKDKDNKPFFSRGDSTGVQAFLAALTQLAKDSSSVIAISHELCDRRPRLLVAAAGKVTAYVIGPDWTLGQGEPVVTLSGTPTPTITALLRKDTDNDGIADRLIVATQPSSGPPQILVYTP